MEAFFFWFVWLFFPCPDCISSNMILTLGIPEQILSCFILLKSRNVNWLWQEQPLTEFPFVGALRSIVWLNSSVWDSRNPPGKVKTLSIICGNQTQDSFPATSHCVTLTNQSEVLECKTGNGIHRILLWEEEQKEYMESTLQAQGDRWCHSLLYLS